MATPKIFQTASFGLNAGKTKTLTTAGWEGNNDVTFGANTAIPYLSLSITDDIETEEDESITNNAYKGNAKLLGRKAGGSLNTHLRYKDTSLLYWALGYASVIETVLVIIGTATGTPVAVGATFVDQTPSTPLNFILRRIEKYKKADGTEDNIYIFTRTAGTVLSVGNMTSGTFIITPVTRKLAYETTYFPEQRGKEPVRAWSSAEATAYGLNVGTDVKTMLATFGKRFKTYDQIVSNAFCTGFKMNINAAGLLQASYDFIGRQVKRSTGGMPTEWTLPSAEYRNTGLVPAHFQSTFEIQPFVGTALNDSLFQNLHLSSFDFGFEQPTQQLQTFTSGLFITDPIIEAKYGFDVSGVIGRHSVATWQDYKTARTPVTARFKTIGGEDNVEMLELLVKRATFDEAGADDSSVAAEPFKLYPEFVETSQNPFSVYCDKDTGRESPVLLRVRTTSNVSPVTKA